MLKIKASDMQTQLRVDDTFIVDKLTEVAKKGLLEDKPLSRCNLGIEINNVLAPYIDCDTTFFIPEVLCELVDIIFTSDANNVYRCTLLSDATLFYSNTLANVLYSCLVLDANFEKAVRYSDLYFLEEHGKSINLPLSSMYKEKLQEEVRDLLKQVISKV